MFSICDKIYKQNQKSKITIVKDGETIKRIVFKQLVTFYLWRNCT